MRHNKDPPLSVLENVDLFCVTWQRLWSRRDCKMQSCRILRRRRKSIMTSEYIQQRVAYCRGVKRKQKATLEEWVCIDGIVYYSNRTDAENKHSKRRSSGSVV